jgi:uncharacterized protein YndB with AHSA1/START domain
MTPITVEPIVLSVETAAPPEVAWSFLTDPERVASWFTDATDVGDVGDRYRLDFGDGSVVEGEIVELTPGRSFAHLWSWTDAEPTSPTLVRWLVEARPAGGSRIQLIHEGWEAAGVDAVLRDEHETYWTGYLDDLGDVLEEVASGEGA